MQIAVSKDAGVHFFTALEWFLTGVFVLGPKTFQPLLQYYFFRILAHIVVL